MNVTVNTGLESFADVFMRWLPLLLPLIIIQYSVLIFVIVDIARKKRTKNLSPLIWIIIALALSNLCMGSILYLIFGRAEKTFDDNDDKDDDI